MRITLISAFRVSVKRQRFIGGRCARFSLWHSLLRGQNSLLVRTGIYLHMWRKTAEKGMSHCARGSRDRLNSLQNSLRAGNFGSETGSPMTPSTATQSKPLEERETARAEWRGTAPFLHSFGSERLLLRREIARIARLSLEALATVRNWSLRLSIDFRPRVGRDSLRACPPRRQVAPSRSTTSTLDVSPYPV